MFRTNWDDLDMLKEIDTHYGTTKKARGPYDTRLETIVVVNKAWLCTDCGEIILKKLIDEPHKCKDASYLINSKPTQLEYKESNDKKNLDTTYTSNSHIRNY